jgi:hypothetical protein
MTFFFPANTFLGVIKLHVFRRKNMIFLEMLLWAFMFESTLFVCAYQRLSVSHSAVFFSHNKSTSARIRQQKKKTSSEQVNRFDSSLVATVLSQFSRLEPPKSLRTCFSIIIYGVLIKKMRWLYCLLTATLSASHYKTFGLVYDVLHSTQSIALPFNTEANYGCRQTIIAKFKRYIFWERKEIKVHAFFLSTSLNLFGNIIETYLLRDGGST